MTELESIERRHTIRLARWSAVLGTLGLITVVLGVGVLLALVAIACAMVALNQLALLRAHDAHGVALLGLIAGVLALLMFPLLLATAVPRYIAARENVNHEHCYANLSALGRSTNRGGLPKLDDAGPLKCPSGGKYRVDSAGSPRCSIPLHNEPPDRVAPPQRLRLS